MKHCIWCEYVDESKGDQEFFYIHRKCATRLMDCGQDIRTIKSILEGTHLRNNLDKDRLMLVAKFVTDMEDFKRRWDNSVQNVQKYLGTETQDNSGSS